MNPLERYRADLQKPGMSHDPAQEAAVKHLQRVWEQLVERETRSPGLLDRFNQKLFKKKIEPVTGLYFWGGVGRGKTWLMDLFYETLPFDRKMRMHFHRFMQRVHHDLKELQGEKNPLEIVAERFAKATCVICFDEFFVSDITDAMILGGLMEQLFSRGVTLVATSNIVPDRLYENGLQRVRFMPAIELVKRYTVVLNVDSGVDYRLRALEQAEIFHFPLDDKADQSLQSSFDSLAMEPGAADQQIEINDRNLKTRREAGDVVWFEFSELCEGPRSPSDYIEIARIYHSVLLSNVPQMNAARDDAARRFINMVDEFYDRNVKLIMSAATSIDDLYTKGRLEFEFQRTRSRLLEMQSHDYLAKEHRG